MRDSPNRILSSAAVLLGAVLCCCPALGYAQTRQDFATKYPEIAAFRVRPGILMTARFDRSGATCEVRIAKEFDPFSTSGKSELTFSDELANQILADVAPASIRGRPLSPYFDPESTVVGTSFFLKKNFENVTIEKVGGESGISSMRVIWTKRRCPTK